MKNNTLITICLFLAFSCTLTAQDYYRVYVDDGRNLLKWGDQHYQKSMQGLRSLMGDLQEIDPELYEQMEQDYAALEKRNKDANVILGVGAGGAMVIMTAGALAAISPNKSGSTTSLSGVQRQEARQNNFNNGFGLIIAGGLLGVVSSALYFNKTVKPNDILDFTNQFNRRSDGDKIELTLQPEIGIGNGGSAGLALRFTF